MLKQHKSSSGKPLELVNTAAKTDRPFSLYFKGQKPSVDLNQALFVPKPDPDGLGVTYEYSDGKVYARKTFRFEKRRYLSRLSTQVSENGKYLPAYVEWRGGFGDLAVPNPSGVQQTPLLQRHRRQAGQA